MAEDTVSTEPGEVLRSLGGRSERDDGRPRAVSEADDVRCGGASCRVEQQHVIAGVEQREDGVRTEDARLVLRRTETVASRFTGTMYLHSFTSSPPSHQQPSQSPTALPVTSSPSSYQQLIHQPTSGPRTHQQLTHQPAAHKPLPPSTLPPSPLPPCLPAPHPTVPLYEFVSI